MHHIWFLSACPLVTAADMAFRSVLTKQQPACSPGLPAQRHSSREGSRAASLDLGGRRRSLSASRPPAAAATGTAAAGPVDAQPAEQQQEQQQQSVALPQAQQQQQLPTAGQQAQQVQQAQQPPQPQQAQQAHQAVVCSAPGWQGNEVATGAVLRRIHKPMMEVRVGRASKRREGHA